MYKILIIDDDCDLLSLTKSLLEKKDFKVKTCTNWSEASHIIMSFNPDLILLDIFLGHADGLLLCSKLKKSRFTRHIPVLICSGFPQFGKIALSEFGASGFIAKPFKIKDVIDKMLEIIGRQQPHRLKQRSIG